jgi:hypothetical protein
LRFACSAFAVVLRSVGELRNCHHSAVWIVATTAFRVQRSAFTKPVARSL